MGTENKRRVINTHERAFTATADQVGALVATLASRTDRLWPHEHWPRMRLDNGLSVGSSGGHGPVSYCMTWPIFFRPLHDSLIEEAFDKATRELDLPLITPHRRSTWVRLLRWIARAA